MSDTEFEVRKISTLPLRTPLLEADLIVIVGDGTPPDGYLGSVQELAELAGSYAPAGPTGETGPQGPAGAPGTNLDIDGSVPTQADLASLSVPTGSVYVVASDGTVWVYDGTQWVKIATGIGPQGPQGPAGATGPQGPQGVPGPVGATGPAGSTLPTGSIIDFAATPAPAGFVLCDGTAYDPLNPLYAPLHSVIGFTYGQSGANFRVPNFNGRVGLGRNPSDANIGTVGKANSMTAANAVVAKHKHGPGTYKVPDHRHDIDHSHPRVTTEDANIPLKSMWLQLPAPNSGPALAVQGSNSGEWPPANRGRVFATPVDNPGGGWDWLFGADLGKLYFGGDGRHKHYYTAVLNNNSLSGYVNPASARTLDASTTSTEVGEDPAGKNYPPYLVINKIIKL